jgi:hypothetical protein
VGEAWNYATSNQHDQSDQTRDTGARTLVLNSVMTALPGDMLTV